tara:strand:+ start:11830 stop:13779 length:1950 start_codon:yes stop_codon:yes gene_type:complete
MPNFSLSATLGLNSAAFQTGMAAATASTTGLRSSLAGLSGPLAALGFIGAARRAVNLGSKISDLGIQLNIGTTELQVLMRATQEAGVGQNSLARALRNVQIRTQEAILGNASYGDAFDRLGINVEAFADLETHEKFIAISQAVQAAGYSQEAYASSARILGERAGPELAEVLRTIAEDGWDPTAEAAANAGQIMGEDVVGEMDSLADTIEDLNTQVTILTANTLTPLIDILTLVSNGWGLIKDSIVAAFQQAGTFGEFVGDLISMALEPLMDATFAVGQGFEALGLAMSGDIRGARVQFESMKDSMRSGFDELTNMPEDFSAAWAAYNEETERTNDEWETKTLDRADAVEEAFDGLFESMGIGSAEATDDLSGIDDGAADAASGAKPPLQGIIDKVFQIATQARLTKEEIEELNEIRFNELTEELNDVEGSITSLSDEILATKQSILDLNSDNLDGLLETFGVTAEQLGDELENQISAAGADGADLSAEELQRAYQTAIANIRQDMREELGDNADFSNTMPSESELQSIIGLMGTVADQSSALAQAPDTVASLTSELGGMVSELGTLEETALGLESEIGGLDESMGSASTALDDQAQAIEEIEIPETLGELIDGELDGIDFSEVTTEIQTTNDKLDEINTTLGGVFVNQ